MNEPQTLLFTPDGRYLIIRGRLWRAANPRLEQALRERLVKQLMDARREVGKALTHGLRDDLVQARRRVQSSKEQLGERGEVWWADGAPDYTRRLIKNTPYADWWKLRGARAGAASDR